MRFVLIISGSFGEHTIACLAYTVLSNITVQPHGEERTSLVVAGLLGQGFGLALTDDLQTIIQSAPTLNPAVTMTANARGLSLNVEDHSLYTLDLDPHDPEDRQWVEAATTGPVLVLGGEHLELHQNPPSFETAATLGTLVIGYTSEPARGSKPHRT